MVTVKQRLPTRGTGGAVLENDTVGEVPTSPTPIDVRLETSEFYALLNRQCALGPVVIVIPPDHTPADLNRARSAQRNRYDVTVEFRAA